CKTKHMPISGGHVGGSKNMASFVQAKTTEGASVGLTEPIAQKLAEKYGSNVSNVFKRVEQLQGEADKRNIPAYVLAELVYAIEEELAVT
ncbi:glycerol-3-phosphate dehydrogenase, partial [Bacillus cereus]